MNTAQESLANSVFPPPCPAENGAPQDCADLPTNKDNNNPFAASAYHVPPKLYAPKADSFHDTIPDGLSAMKMPDRCQFMFSDGRQCTMARSDIHPSLCFYHADREEQLFGDPSYRCETRKLDFPELFSACRDLSTAAGVNRALAQVFRLLAQRRISRQEAATFGHLAKLLLRTISLMSAESVAAAESDEVILSERSERRISPQPPPERGTSSPSSPRTQPLRPSKNQPEPLPGGYVMKSGPEKDASSIFCRPATPVLSEERFVLSGCARSEAFTAENPCFAQLQQNQHLQNPKT